MDKKYKHIIKKILISIGIGFIAPFIIKLLMWIWNTLRWQLCTNCLKSSLLEDLADLPLIFKFDNLYWLFVIYSIPLIIFFYLIYNPKKKINLFKFSPIAFLIFIVITLIVSVIVDNMYPVPEGCVREGPFACLPGGMVFWIFVGGFSIFLVFIPYMILYAIIMVILHFIKRK